MVRGSRTLVDGLVEAVRVSHLMNVEVGQSDETDRPSNGSSFHGFLDRKRLFIYLYKFFRLCGITKSRSLLRFSSLFICETILKHKT